MSDGGWRLAWVTIRLFHRVLHQPVLYALEEWGGWAGAGPVGYGPSGSSAPGKLRKRSGSGHAAAKARRSRLAVSTTRAAIFKRRRRSVANSAVANSRALGMASRTVSINQ